MPKNILLTGLPGSGKTTLIRNVLSELPGWIRCAGFFTAEVREGRERTGFEIVTLDGCKGPLASSRLKSLIASAATASTSGDSKRWSFRFSR